MKKTIKIINKKYRVEADGKNCLYVSEKETDRYHYSEFVFKDRPLVLVLNGGINLYRISTKLKRRFKGFLDQGYSIYASGSYIFTKDHDSF